MRQALALAMCLVLHAEGMYFHITEGKQRCFIEEVPEDTLVMATYHSADYKKTTPAGDHRAQNNPRTVIKISVLDPDGELLVSHDAEKTGRVAFTSPAGGEHKICVLTNTSSWFGQTRTFRFKMQVHYGEHATDYKEVAKQEHLSAIEVEIRKLNDKIRDIRAEQEYQQTREEQFRNVSESTNGRVMWFSIFQTVILFLSGLWQIANLKSFFKSKKL
mmetsp:Transcript_22974/g.25510  ORF Transcript_22974/g.25510 Transcript_22974/m.25510 type:complete len:217 (-) Transcript_22974:55-705(-)|eukprot:CAMPEP_0205820494 /NCGR_PEP_ID=MMETSP0206-20130828/3142_1 /ASSEMBLY_ACC=CAM_ASM_000279 /TAXON_ID=36767 /ORGANISM="Euplotes focardii, Strain TN1" /LENGTH=216 /DNA_ID=CAMNT_0053115261 /DNA_START=27 /DNA_END=677 /DNA_ORIENTATION=-